MVPRIRHGLSLVTFCDVGICSVDVFRDSICCVVGRISLIVFCSIVVVGVS